MKNKLLFTLFALMIILCGLTIMSAQAVPLGSFDINDKSGSSDIFNQIHHTVTFGWDIYDPSSEAIVFDLILSTNDVGQTYTVSSGIEFDKAVAYLTNGIIDSIIYEISGYPARGGGSTAFNEAYLFFGDPTGAKGIDFTGYSIDNICLFVNSLDLDTPGQNPNGNGVWTDVIFNAMVTINGSAAIVPEPSTCMLLFFGLVGLTGFKKKFKS